MLVFLAWSVQRLADRILVTRLTSLPVNNTGYKMQGARCKIKNLFLVISFSF